MLTEQDLPSVFPSAYGRYRLLKHLGGGWTSDVYLAELAAEPDATISGLKQFALKLAIDKTCYYPGVLTRERIEVMMLKEHANANLLDHPCVIRLYSDAVPESRRHIESVSEAGCCNVRQLQGAMTDPQEDWNNTLPMPLIKFIAAQLVLGMQYLHSKQIYWGDPMPQNVVIMPDFTIRIIDIVAEWAPDLVQENDLRMLAAALYNMHAGDIEMAHKPKEWLLERFDNHRAEAPLFYEMLTDLLSAKSVDGVWDAKFWESQEGGSASFGVNITGDNEKLEEVMKLKRAAWYSLPSCAQKFLRTSGVKEQIY